MSEIEDYFTGNQILSLTKKPKIFIYDCCRGNNYSYVCDNVYKSTHNQPNQRLNKDSNFIKIHATTTGHKVSDRKKQGSFLTQSIEKIFFPKPNIVITDKCMDYSKYKENILNLNLFEMFRLIKYETEKCCGGWQCMEYVSTQNSAIYLQKYQP